MECGDAQLGEIFNKDHIRCWSWDGNVQLRYKEKHRESAFLHAFVLPLHFHPWHADTATDLSRPPLTSYLSLY